MSDTGSKEDVLSTEEVDALVERTQTQEFDDGEFRIHDFEGGPRLAMAKWSELTILVEKQAEALTSTLSSEYGLKISVDMGSLSYGVARDLHAALPERLCLVSTLLSLLIPRCICCCPEAFLLRSLTTTLAVTLYLFPRCEVVSRPPNKESENAYRKTFPCNGRDLV